MSEIRGPSTTHRRHRMPFGAELCEDQRVRFRLWAPGAREVELCLGTGPAEITLGMASEPYGWFGLITNRAEADTLYRFFIDDERRVPDPASRFQPEDCHGPSQVIDPEAYEWQDVNWSGRRWEEAVIYELHVGTFTPEGSFAGVVERLDYLAELGVTAIELMPVADFAGTRNWGYDGVLPFAPDSRYGTPADLKRLVDAAHARDLMVFLDVVYNHFGPEGNYLHVYAPQFFTESLPTPWGAAIDFERRQDRFVRQFFVHNALYWLEEYHLDGLRMDAVDRISDDSTPDFLTELALCVRQSFGRDRQIHLVLENDRNEARYLERTGTGQVRLYDAQWNDDFHHAVHVLLTGEDRGYYRDYTEAPIRHLVRCLVEGFAYQGEPSPYRGGRPRGEHSEHLPSVAFVDFLQNHDQIGNRAFGERIHRLTEPSRIRAALTVLLLLPSVPLLFMGQEWGTQRPFLFFADFEPGLARDVTAGRRREFARFSEFADPLVRDRIPDPVAPNTFQVSILDWTELDRPEHRAWLEFHQTLLRLRHESIVPLLREGLVTDVFGRKLGDLGLDVVWRLADGSRLTLMANFGADRIKDAGHPAGALLFASDAKGQAAIEHGVLPGWFAAWSLETPGDAK